jgi:hypothetical protein
MAFYGTRALFQNIFCGGAKQNTFCGDDDNERSGGGESMAPTYLQSFYDELLKICGISRSGEWHI